MKLLLISLAIVEIALSLVAQSPPPPTPTIHAQNEKQNRTNDHHDTTAHPQQTIGAIAHDEPAKNQNSNNGIILVFTGVIAFAAIAQVVAMVVQAHYMRRGLAVTDHAAKAAQQSADAATQAVALAKRTQPVTERAVVLIETVTASTPELERPTVVIFTLKNYGRTAAYSAKLTGFLTFRAGSEPIRDMPETTIAPQGANVWITKSIGLRMTQEQIDNVNAGNTAFRYQIEVTYLDAFENSHRYRVEGQYEAALRQFIITSSTSD